MALNIGALKSPSGILKIVHVLLGVINLGIIGYYSTQTIDTGIFSTKGGVILANEIFFYLLVVYACLFTSFFLLISFIFGDTAEQISKSTFEIVYHLFSFIFYAAAAICLITVVAKIPSFARTGRHYAAFVFAVLTSIANALAYGANAFVGFRAG